MKNFFLFCLTAFLSTAVFAQKVYFIYVQTDNQSPFYVRMADKVYSSSTSGYLILPNLTDSTYGLNVGFAKSTQPETRFNVTINQGDKGYLVKNFEDGLALFDMQELSLVKASTGNNDKTVYETKSDRFSSILSKAADDPSLLKVPVKKEEQKIKQKEEEVVSTKKDEGKKTEIAQVDTIATKPVFTVETKAEQASESTTKVDSALAETTKKPTADVSRQGQKDETVSDMQSFEFKRSVIKRHSESSTTEGFGITYFDKRDNGTDTIRILIPAAKLKLDEESQLVSLDESKKEESKNKSSDEKKPDVFVETKTEKKEAVAALGCQNIASEKDFMKLRKNMAAKSNEDEMIAEARKSFKTRCYTSEQIRYLSTLFLTSASKYQFFDAAFNYVSDKQSFSSLQSEIRDEYYLKRFKALIGE